MVPENLPGNLGYAEVTASRQTAPLNKARFNCIPEACPYGILEVKIMSTERYIHLVFRTAPEAPGNGAQALRRPEAFYIPANPSDSSGGHWQRAL